MPMMQTRRRFLTTLSLAGIADLLPKARSLAAEGPLVSREGEAHPGAAHLHRSPGPADVRAPSFSPRAGS